MPHIPELKQYRRRAKLSQAGLARRSGIDSNTVSRAENGYFVQDVKCVLIIEALNEVPPFDKSNISMDAIKEGGLNGQMPKRDKVESTDDPLGP